MKARITQYENELNGTYWIVEYKKWYTWTQLKDHYGLGDGLFWNEEEAMTWFRYFQGDMKDKLIPVMKSE